MYYTIYKITNKVNSKFYIGMHKTTNLDDGYMGSGKMLKRAIEKHGIENFTKEILHIFDNEEDMKNKEKDLVVLSEMSYNLCEGGKGGWSFVNRNNLNLSGKIAAHSPDAKEKRSLTMKNIMLQDDDRRKFLSNWSKENGNGMLGKTHSEETKKKMSGKRGKYNVNKTGIKRGPYKKRTLPHSSIGSGR